MKLRLTFAVVSCVLLIGGSFFVYGSDWAPFKKENQNELSQHNADTPPVTPPSTPPPLAVVPSTEIAPAPTTIPTSTVATTTVPKPIPILIGTTTKAKTEKKPSSMTPEKTPTVTPSQTVSASTATPIIQPTVKPVPAPVIQSPKKDLTWGVFTGSNQKAVSDFEARVDTNPDYLAYFVHWGNDGGKLPTWLKSVSRK